MNSGKTYSYDLSGKCTDCGRMIEDIAGDDYAPREEEITYHIHLQIMNRMTMYTCPETGEVHSRDDCTDCRWAKLTPMEYFVKYGAKLLYNVWDWDAAAQQIRISSGGLGHGADFVAGPSVGGHLSKIDSRITPQINAEMKIILLRDTIRDVRQFSGHELWTLNTCLTIGQLEKFTFDARLKPSEIISRVINIINKSQKASDPNSGDLALSLQTQQLIAEDIESDKIMENAIRDNPVDVDENDWQVFAINEEIE